MMTGTDDDADTVKSSVVGITGFVVEAGGGGGTQSSQPPGTCQFPGIAGFFGW